MNGLHWMVAFNLAAFGCMSLGELPPSKLPKDHPRMIASRILMLIGVGGLIADIFIRS